LDYVGVPFEHREVSLRLGDARIRADGYDPMTKTIYEFWGDYWHGNPQRFHPDDMNVITKTTFGYLYKRTLNKRKLILDHGYNLVEIWESDWRKVSDGGPGDLHPKESQEVHR
jgi:hypothetical protein